MDIKEIKKKIEEYVEVILFLHDLSVFRNDGNRQTADRIIAKCMESLEAHEGLSDILKTDTQIEYFVRQTILYMV